MPGPSQSFLGTIITKDVSEIHTHTREAVEDI